MEYLLGFMAGLLLASLAIGAFVRKYYQKLRSIELNFEWKMQKYKSEIKLIRESFYNDERSQKLSSHKSNCECQVCQFEREEKQ